ncbi:GGDEF domain-containing protein [Clostridium sp.]|uniref:sensor domain-containing diguanylate cyclase n=1 Tax=Clostridium sp. TaxID=1506 RepID=UPI002846A5AB|nr:GGDEF domain-containing protein [Clostridium sp.]MDR3595904.1 GGDEF domain-containing protein [Clostridium sp.]
MNISDMREKIDELLKKANGLRYVDSNYTIEISNEALNLAKEIGYILGEKISILYIACAYNNIGKNEEALPLLLDTLHYSVKEGIYDIKWMTYNTLGMLFCDLGDIERSMEFYNNAQEAAMEIDLGKKYHEDFNSTRSIVLTLNNIAENYKILKEYKDALNYCEKAYNIDKKFDYSLSKGLIVLSLGEIYYLIGDYEKADGLSHQALRHLTQYNYNIAEADAYKLMALTSWKKGNYEKADEYFNIAMELNDREAIPNYEIDALISYYEYLKDREKLTEALEILTNACNLSIQYNIPEKVSETSILLSIFYGDLGDYENSLKCANLHYDYEKIYTESYHKNIFNSLNIKKKMQEIEKENNEIAEKNRNLRTQKQSLQILVEKISIISELGQKITSILDKDSLIDALYSSIKSFMNLSFLGIGLYDENSGMINYLDVVYNGEKEKRESISINDKTTFAGVCIKKRELIIINNTSEEFIKYIDEKTYTEQLKLRNNADLNSLIFCPLIVNTKVIGMMTIQSEEKDAFTSYHVEMVKSLSSYAAVAINNAIKSMELENLNEILLASSEKDKLTGIANRRKFDDYINYIWNVSIEERNSIALLIIDIDYFKEYNDNFGHLEGDKCIASVADALANLNARQYFAGRYGGDEFVVILPKCSIKEASEFAENLKTTIVELNIPHKFSKISDKVTLSIGVASIVPNKDTSINQLLKKADDALYIAKKRGRNQVATND